MEKFSILILDDVEENIYSLKLMIEDSFDTEIYTALNAQDAISILMNNKVDLILSDIQMPDVDGFQFVDYIKSLEITKDIPVIFITGIYDKDSYQKKGYDLGVIEYISKPIDNDLLTSKLKVFIKIFEEKKSSKEELDQANKLLVHNAKMASMGEMIGVISHQLKQPLNIMSLYCNDIKYSYDTDDLDRETIDKFDKDTKQQIKHMTNTIDSFLNFFNSEKKLTTIPIKKAIVTFIDLMKAQIRKSGIDLKVDIEDAYIVGVEMELAQVFINIITNSIQAYNEREIENRPIEIKVYKENDKVILTIGDFAGGIDENNMEKLFDPYFTTKSDGTGIGLYMVKLVIINSFKGELKVENSDKGLKFIMTFPSA
ncbi:hybrid sensor histidine kinase/response regulator [Arcobacter sp. F2176]|jgi:signal transduction histidine kinase|uniref:hybrid sensor histidine kinase/response regulator n=1 Tax=Arcobacter sp. F2176 TaxID=2044511 RepID=UPI00100AE5E4|nr:hybrid sensor histidine kinase/response regulator [Arcobacter sp. F2176]RXJ82595.1 hybrid sensor histidine kinase/response regulator [Arcobacter sp. F2176]|tara:strand:+ start:426 stop:1535 length:1110 start_codon:yes stop_codon:yes gene_type:complete